MKALSTEELTAASEAVITGVVEDMEAQWSTDGKTIFTRAYIRITQTVRGRLNQQIVLVEYEGGEVGGIGLRVSDVAPLEKGENVLLYLKNAKVKGNGKAYNIVGKAQGHYSIGKDGIARKRGFSVIDGQTGVDNDMPLEDIIKKIRSIR